MERLRAAQTTESEMWYTEPSLNLRVSSGSTQSGWSAIPPYDNKKALAEKKRQCCILGKPEDLIPEAIGKVREVRQKNARVD